MSLLFVIDGYNIINHTRFTPITKKTKDSQRALLDFIKTRKLAASPKNKVVVVFDGYPKLSNAKLEGDNVTVIFSQGQKADAKIKKILESQGNPRNTIVISDDNQIKFFTRALGARSLAVEEFIGHKDRALSIEKDLLKTKLSYSQIHKINRELKAIWLKD
jgi:predicted RNA-binding protein with PIN domain